MTAPLTITTLKRRADFLRLRHGQKVVSPFFMIRAAKSVDAAQTDARVGYTVTTKCGNAVLRNRSKRRLRALVAEIFPSSARAGYDYSIIVLDKAKPNVAAAEYGALREAMQQAIGRLHRA